MTIPCSFFVAQNEAALTAFIGASTLNARAVTQAGDAVTADDTGTPTMLFHDAADVPVGTPDWNNWAVGPFSPWTLDWNAGTRTLTLSVAANDGLKTISYVVPSQVGANSLLVVRVDAQAPTANTWPRSINPCRVQLEDLTLNGTTIDDALADIEVDTNGGVVGSAPMLAVVLYGYNFIGQNWTLSGTRTCWWGYNEDPPVANGVTRRSVGPGYYPAYCYPPATSMALSIGLFTTDETLTGGTDENPVPINYTVNPYNDESGCFTPTIALPPSCLVQDNTGCFRYRFDCVDGEWQLTYAECVDNDDCGSTVIKTCDGDAFIFEARGTCTFGEPAPIPVDPLITDGCEPTCGGP
jgi:hypothetical protein